MAHEVQSPRDLGRSLNCICLTGAHAHSQVRVCSVFRGRLPGRRTQRTGVVWRCSRAGWQGLAPATQRRNLGCRPWQSSVRQRSFSHRLNLKQMISLPRQAQDKHWKSSEIDRFLADDYDCHRNGHSGCDGDPGNGVMVGWFLWAQVSRHHRHHLVIIIVIIVIVIVIIVIISSSSSSS